MEIDTIRLLRRIDELAAIGGRPDGGVTRLAFSEADRAGRDYVERVLRDRGLEVRVDAIGNLFGIVPGRADTGAVMAGSHTDTVVTGGRFDGALGVLAALEVAESLVDAGVTPEKPFIVASFVNEEGVRYMPDMMGSLFHRGSLTESGVRAVAGADGTTIGDELDRWGMAGSDHIADLAPDAFVEVHIEQGPVLDLEKLPVACVRGVQGLAWYEVTVRGTANHAGTTPMEARHDAGATAGDLMYELRRLPADVPGLRLTIGTVRHEPNLINVIPHTALFTVDVRHEDTATLRHTRNRIETLLDRHEDVHYRILADAPAVTFDSGVRAAIDRAMDAEGLTPRTLTSGAGHDAQILAHTYRCGMIFVRTRDGVSHNVTEHARNEDVVAGARVLARTVSDLLRQDGPPIPG